MTAAVAIPPPTPFPQLDEVVKRVKDASAEFARLSIDERIAMVEAFRDGYRAIAEQSVRLACAAKGIDFESPQSGEEWLGGPMVTIRDLRLLGESLRDVKRYGAPKLERSWFRQLPDGRWAVKVYPTTAIDKMLLAKHLGEVYLKPGITPDNIKQHQASFYRAPHRGRVCLVLGAGNVNSIPPMDVVYKMFVEGTVCVLKMNPVNAYLGPLLERAFGSGVKRGFFAVVYGGADEGSHLVNHPLIDEVHITGSDKTHDAMVWGPAGPDSAARRARNEPLLKKDITSELGCITPVLVVPGPWTAADLEYQSRNVAGMVANNASFNCNSAKLLVTQKGWSGRATLLAGIEKWLGNNGTRLPYYPGADQRWKQFTEGRANVKLIGQSAADRLQWALITDVDHEKRDDRVFTQEPWCGLLSETNFDAPDVPGYLQQTVKFINERVWGTLSAIVLVHPTTLEDPKNRAAFDQALLELRYGAVAVNTWPGAVYGLCTAPWGGHPSSTLQDIQSGRGVVHNTFMIDGVEKFVLSAPIRASPIAPWFPAHRTVDTLARRLMDLEMGPSWLKVPGIAAAAMRG